MLKANSKVEIFGWNDIDDDGTPTPFQKGVICSLGVNNILMVEGFRGL